MKIKQISVFVENKSGRLAEITEIIAENDINIKALSIADTTDFGILRIIVDCPEKAEKILRYAGFTVSMNTVIAVKIPDKPGGLASALKFLSEKGFTVEYIYAFLSKNDKEAYVVLRVDREDEAIKALEQAGFEGGQEEILN